MHWWNKYVGLLFKEHGRDRSGFDCWGLVRFVFQEEKKLTLPDRLEYASTRDYTQTVKLVTDVKGTGFFLEVAPSQVRDFDIVVLKIAGFGGHCGIVCNGGKSFLHVVDGANSVIEPLNGIRWSGRIESFWRVQ